MELSHTQLFHSSLVSAYGYVVLGLGLSMGSQTLRRKGRGFRASSAPRLNKNKNPNLEDFHT